MRSYRRSIGGYSTKNEFVRQLAERNAEQQPQKKFRAMAAPKGTKLASGYVDRARARDEGNEDSDKVQRVKALEDMMKLQQIDETTFIKLREEILGKDVGERAGLVKGLDWALLDRVKKGEVSVQDVLDEEKRDESEPRESVDVDDEFEALEGKSIEAVAKTQTKKKGEMAPAELTGKKRTRDQVLAEMKAARLAAKEAAQPSLGTRFKKVGDHRVESRIEQDSKGREVLITVDEHGNEKRKVRKIPPNDNGMKKNNGLLMPDKDLKPLGMIVPEIPKIEAEEDNDDIFADVGDDYDPLAGLEEEDSDTELENGEGTVKNKVRQDAEATSSSLNSMPPPPKPVPKDSNRNYFGTPTASAEPTSSKPMALSDPTLLAAIKKASTLNAIPKAAESAEEAAKEAKRRKMLENNDRDAQDMDMGFGSSRFEDEEDFEEQRVKLSEWGQEDEDDGGDGKGSKGKRKRGGKKRKGDKNSAADVLGVMKRQREEATDV